MELLKALKTIFLIFAIGNMIMLIFATGFSPFLASYPLLSLMLGVAQFIVLLAIFKDIKLVKYVLVAHCMIVVIYAVAILAGIVPLSDPWGSIFTIIIYWGVLPTVLIVLPISAIFSFQLLPSMLITIGSALAVSYFVLYYYNKLIQHQYIKL